MRDVIILGKAGSGQLCPFDAEEIWAVNDTGNMKEFEGKRIDKAFAFDPLPEDIVQKIKASGVPIVSWQPYADIEYPLKKIAAEFGSEYFTNTVSYMLAYALFVGVSRISLYGIDAVASGGIYAMEKSGLEYWIGRAQGAGLKVEVSQGSHLLRTITNEVYGIQNRGALLLYLIERMHLLTLLPETGHYEEMTKVGMLQYQLSIKTTETEKHKVTAGNSTQVGVSTTELSEFVTEYILPEALWTYLAGLLRAVEQKGKLPRQLVSVYEKVVLGGSGEPAGIGIGQGAW